LQYRRRQEERRAISTGLRRLVEMARSQLKLFKLAEMM
jgi:hypothetical protein